MDGLTQTSEVFRGRFRVNARGMGKPRWADSAETLAMLQPPDDIDLPMQISDFRDAASELEGSRDIGSQLYCAMLRAAGCEARLVCSLQPLPFQPSQKVELQQVQQCAQKIAERKAWLNVSSKDSRGRSTSPAFEMLNSRSEHITSVLFETD